MCKIKSAHMNRAIFPCASEESYWTLLAMTTASTGESIDVFRGERAPGLCVNVTQSQAVAVLETGNCNSDPAL